MPDHETFWRKTHARNARLLVDAAEYFRVLRHALLSARHSIWIIGWDIHSRMRFFGANEPVDGWPRELGEFLKALATARSELSINVLVWKSIILYAGEREWFPAAQFEGPDNLVFCLDDSLPLGSAQHQKFVVIDDSLAFAGGLDLTIRRWDDHTHAARSGDRIDLFTMSSSWWTAIRRCDLANLQELDLTLLVTNAPPGSWTERTYGLPIWSRIFRMPLF